ncbi:alkyl hydroperoxide reductase [Spirosoma pollinicola]|uniref:Alkyl hydroperoxide reductase n=2 Tax=Spirosoma pollinicola TaxID=2057025 RepID=A0A2K8ZAA0_9BACT|nr:alkyl hydroperoxide reductase [Spirosoma pollinicola]
MKSFLLIFLLLIPTLLWGQSNVYKIEGNIAKVKPGTIAYVRYAVEVEKKVYSDSAQIHNGKFSITGTVDQPHLARLFIDQNSIRFYLEPGAISIISLDSVQDAVVSRSPMNIDNQKLKKILKPTDEQMTMLQREYKAATPEQKKEKGFDERFEKRSDAISAQQGKLKAQFIQANPTSMLSLYVLKDYTDWFTPEFSEVELMFSQFSEAIKTSKPGKAYAQTLAVLQTTSVGATAPEFAQPDTSGKTISLSSFRGKYVLVDFWASWCVPCRAENPNLVKNFQQYKDKNFTVLGVSLDRPNAKEAWLKAIRKDGLDWTHVSDLKHWDSEVVKQYAIRLIPQNFLIGPDGKILAKNIRGEALGVKLAELFRNKP